jgi:glucan phosphoethanolaminetransferase (alkaline phosphatase superfamily)
MKKTLYWIVIFGVLFILNYYGWTHCLDMPIWVKGVTCVFCNIVLLFISFCFSVYLFDTNDNDLKNFGVTEGGDGGTI